MSVTVTTPVTPQRAQRDLAWCLHSPGLVLAGADNATWPSDDWYQQLDTTGIADLPVPGHTHHFRLGHHFERLLKCWLTQHPQFHLSAANLQVQDGKRTVGEFDFLVSNQHWEAAVKFYLGTTDCTQMHNWFGTNTADRFDIKYDRLINHQLILSNNPTAARMLAERQITVTESLCFMKGRLFYPYEMFVSNNFSYPDIVNPTHEKGWWMSAEQFSAAFDHRHRYVHLEKLFWLSPIQQDVEGASLEEMRDYLASGREPATLIAVLDDNGMEQSRGFVVDDRWLASVASNQSGRTSTG